MVNKVNVKYITKKEISAPLYVFLKIKNQTSAIIRSSRNLRLTATRVCIVWESGSLVSPLKNIIRVVTEINEKKEERITMSLRGIFE